MKRTSVTLGVLAAAMLLQGSNSIYAQSTGGDEQGLSIPAEVSLPQDRMALTEARDGWWTDARKNYDERMGWYNDAKFGCFIHWGVYSDVAGFWHGKHIGGYTEHLMRKATIPLDVYRKEVVAPFNPTGFDADEWMSHARDAGMKYFIVTAKHHDGFAMFPSDAYPYDIRQTSFDRDPMGELREAARRYGIKFGFYYSHAFDWEHPDAPGNDWDYDNPGGDRLLGGAEWWTGGRRDFLPKAEKYVAEKSIPQIQELIRNYQPDILWFDTPAKLPLYLNVRILKAIREADPENKIVVNGRLARYGGSNLGDYRNTGDRAAFFFPTEGPWESIPTTNESYGYSIADSIRKPAPFFIRLLASATSKGGNILMNVGPMGNGKWDEKDVEIFRGVGEWLRRNGRSIYGAERTDLPVQPWGVTTWKGDTLYAHVFHWPEDGELVIGGLRSSIVSASLLADGSTTIPAERLGTDDWRLNLPANTPDTVNTVIEIVTGGRTAACPVRLLDHRRSNTLATFDATLHGRGLGYGDGKPNRNHVKNWRDNSQSMSWNLRLNAPAEYDVYLDYNTVSADDSGIVNVRIGGKDFEVPYTGHPERLGTKSLPLGSVSLAAGEFGCELTGKSYTGKTYMTPIAVRLEPR